MGHGFNKTRKSFQFTAAGYVVSNGKVLLVAHKQLRKLLPPGGHLKEDANGMFFESPEEAAVREVKEETGLDVEIVGKRYVVHSSDEETLFIPESMHIHSIDEEHDHYGFDFFCVPKSVVKKLSGEEKCRWFSEEDLIEYPSNMKPELTAHVKATAIQAIKKLSP